jgi:hypothetical protein
MKTNTIYLTILFLLLVLNSCCDETPKVNLAVVPDTALCTIDAQTMEDNYIVNKDFINHPGYDNRVISFTNKQMVDGLTYLREKAKEHNVNEEELGFRVYIGAKYIEDFNQKVDKVKGDMKSIRNEPGIYYTTVFFVATKKSADSDDENDYENIYEIPALNYGGSRRPPKKYEPTLKCQVHNVIH